MTDIKICPGTLIRAGAEGGIYVDALLKQEIGYVNVDDIVLVVSTTSITIAYDNIEIYYVIHPKNLGWIGKYVDDVIL